MSTNTLVFGLFEYDAETDGNLPFNITQALNNNWDKIDSLVPLLSTIAAPYSSSTSYSVGAYCTYQGNLQRCNTNIPTSEPWNSSHWDAVTIMSQSVNSEQINQPNGVAGLNEQYQLDSSVIPPLNYDPLGSANTVQQNLTTHINNTDNPHQVTSQQIGALLAISAAAAYNPSSTYAVGDYCTNDGNLYKCSTPIESGEAWNAEHWTETTVAKELNEVRTSLSNKADISIVSTRRPLQIDELNKTTPYSYTAVVGPTSDFGPRYDFWYVEYGWFDANTGVQVITSPTGGDRWYRIFGAGEPGDWIKFSTATPPQVRNLTLQFGFSANGDCTFFVTQESAVFLAGGVSGTLPANQDTQIGTLPADVSPSAQRRRPAVTDAGTAYIDIHTDGTVWAHPFVAASQCWFDTSFVAGGGS